VTLRNVIALSLAEHEKPASAFHHPTWGGNITGYGADVLPRLPPWAIADGLRRLPEEELQLTLRTKVLPVVTLPGLRLFATFGPAARAIAARDGLRVVAEAPAADFIAASREALGAALLKEATHGLAQRHPSRSASRRLSQGQIAGLWAALPAIAAAVLLLPAKPLLLALSLLGGLFFLAIIALRILCLMPPPPMAKHRAPELADDDLPVYSVLVPLFRETSVLGQLLTGLTRLNYPADRLDIKLILEESDILMQRAVAGLTLPPHFDVIVVPSGLPQTKPRALNYALHFARGDLLTIFDAEDIPEPNQLRVAAEHFAALPGGVACLQAQLVFYNPNENWLTRQFTIEYATLFGVMLPALAAHGLPFPLGGTSNHFRSAVLRRIGAWDPFNVTEDADLGLRFARAGYQTATIAAHTYEEANMRLGNWLSQRARWLKGFLQTWLVHMRSPLRFLGEVGPAGFWATQTMTLGVFGSALLHPVCLAVTLGVFAFGPPLPAAPDAITIVLAGLNLAVLLAGYAVAMIGGARGLRRLHIRGWGAAIASMPLYWLLMSFAAWLALWQFVVAPFHWNKTQHGLSSFQRRRKARARG
jgi:glycosyltransferase XagB